jgi:hypothetical protein
MKYLTLIITLFISLAIAMPFYRHKNDTYNGEDKAGLYSSHLKNKRQYGGGFEGDFAGESYGGQGYEEFGNHREQDYGNFPEQDYGNYPEQG